MIHNNLFRIRVLVLVVVTFHCLIPSSGFSQEPSDRRPVYLSFLIHCEASPIRGVPVDVQTEPYSGEGVLPRNRYLHRILDVCEKYGIKFEFAVTPIFAQQLKEDRPDLIERIKRMKLPISRYPSLAGHVLPPPVGEMRDMPGMRLQQLRNREISWEDYLKNEWVAETRTLAPVWRLVDGRLIMDNPRAGTPVKLEELPNYRIPKKEDRLYGGVLALQEIFGVIPLPTFPRIFKNDTTRFKPTPVTKALGMWSFETSYHPIEVFNAPIRANNPRMADWFVKHFPVDKPLHADSGFAYTYDYNGAFIGLNVKEEIIQYAVEHPEEYKIVWPDPEGRQWAPENSPLKFYQRTYGVSSLREVREMTPPIQKILEMDASIPIREVKRNPSAGRSGWQKDFLYTLTELGIKSDRNLPDFLRPKTFSVTLEQVRGAASWIVENTTFNDQLGTLPRQITAGAENWSLSRTFVALVKVLEHFGLYDRLPQSIEYPEVLGPVDYPLAEVETPAQLDDQVDRLRGVPDNPFVNEVNLFQGIWETAERVRKDQQVPGRIQLLISRNRRGNYRGQSSQVNAAELLFLMAQELVEMDKVGLPDEIPFKRIVLAPVKVGAQDHMPAWTIQDYWNQTESNTEEMSFATPEQTLEAAEYLMVAWAKGHLGHSEDIGGPPYGVPFDNGGKWSLNETFQALAYALDHYHEHGELPDKSPIRQVLGPVNYPMYELRNEPAYNIRMLRGGWQPYQLDVRDFPSAEIINRQALPSANHGSYQGYVAASVLLASVHDAVLEIRDTGIIPGSIRINLPSRRGPRRAPVTNRESYLNAAELLWGMAQLYRYLHVLGAPDDVYLRSCRLIQDQLHYLVVGLNPIGFSRQTYRYRRDFFDWIEKVPVWRVHQTWDHSAWR